MMTFDLPGDLDARIELNTEELERGMSDTKVLIDSCRAMDDDCMAELHLIWLDILLDRWVTRTAEASPAWYDSPLPSCDHGSTSPALPSELDHEPTRRPPP